MTPDWPTPAVMTLQRMRVSGRLGGHILDMSVCVCVCVCVCVMDCVKMEGADVGGAMTCRGWYGAQTRGEAINHSALYRVGRGVGARSLRGRQRGLAC